MTIDVLTKIASRGYWKVVMQPPVFKPDRIAGLLDCEKLVANCQVSLRGWDYPHYETMQSGIDHIWSQTDWEDYKEFWRFYQSGQFVHYFGCHEDWWIDSGLSTPELRQRRPGEVLEIISTLFQLTEIYEFASRLAQRGIFDEQTTIVVELHGMRGRKLIALHRILFPINYTCAEKDLPFEKRFSTEELIAKTSELALEHALWVFERFNWRHVRSADVVANLREQQKKLLERRL